MEFEWDSAKQIANLAKHGLDFVLAEEVFGDPLAYEYSSSGDHGEDRCVRVGALRGLIVAVVFVERGSRIRIISMRVARRAERTRYGQG